MPPPIAPSEVHVNEDIRQIMRAMLAMHESMRMMAPETSETLAYTKGFRTAFRLLAEALGIEIGELRR